MFRRYCARVAKRDFSTRVRKGKRVNEISVDSNLIEAERSAVPSHTKRELSSAGLEHLPYKQRVGGSNPSAPTKSRRLFESSFFVSAEGFVQLVAFRATYLRATIVC